MCTPGWLNSPKVVDDHCVIGVICREVNHPIITDGTWARRRQDAGGMEGRWGAGGRVLDNDQDCVSVSVLVSEPEAAGRASGCK